LVLTPVRSLNPPFPASTVGGVVGFALAFKGAEAVIWNEETLEFPFRKGITVIVISWFTSPVFACVGAIIIFFLCRTLVLRRENSFQKSFYVLPAAILLTIFINVFFVLSKARTKLSALTKHPDSPTPYEPCHHFRSMLYVALFSDSFCSLPHNQTQNRRQGAGKMLLDDAKKPGGDQSWCSNDGCKDIKDDAGLVTKKNGINTNKAGWVAVAAAAGVAVVGSAILIPLLKRQAVRKFENEGFVAHALATALLSSPLSAPPI
jgi:phosphate/sulfate permease